ncbi:MAG TPA: bifunctional adenosylcobinamide kinase/adenosylcobinamide-phosphate guanylyltransferase [Marmoricola sp.]|jgi:adenosylcobinamide kinase/adenosylcobinamide-phosphate guanylyltransferase|nr:bifunctional adenosylcobinamide kinase/adenosylcobinamide-phosphate guanylyltransferase [Marmoricola sp.]
MKILVTGGVRSGKSRHAESLLAGPATYLAPGPSQDDADWAARIAAHRARRPAVWTTVESPDLVGILSATAGDLIIDCLGTWLTAVLDEDRLWDATAQEAGDRIGRLAAEASLALRARTTTTTVIVTNEVGLGVVPAHRSGRLFRDLLGVVNQELAAACDEVHLVVAGRVLRL